MAGMTCSQCGAPITPGANCCEYCGNVLEVKQAPVQQPQIFIQPPPPMYQQPPMQNMYHQNMQSAMMMSDGIDPSWPIKNKVTAGILALLLGSFGIHKFYLGQIALGVVYLVLCATGIPALLGIVDGIIILTSNDHNFQVKNKVRIQ